MEVAILAHQQAKHRSSTDASTLRNLSQPTSDRLLLDNSLLPAW